ncbi:hypothetical protein [Nostoc sp. WHI]|nr:hypothetical protein [Nostoc sp. WHI]
MTSCYTYRLLVRYDNQPREMSADLEKNLQAGCEATPTWITGGCSIH